ncbi:unnamed protein product [Zymoseptoria tritici ST99CH_1A5]|uniref:non-specific serine/threonine protein kinase n=1 Tax=Zymoseptoria tritici ST99CH_1A5 TaxID=1276529 RepID=A0A1Y6LIF3_ZYMTR|nr:unnamed protein product [Zymoseptoria tritici ST99CH_1A5]
MDKALKWSSRQYRRIVPDPQATQTKPGGPAPVSAQPTTTRQLRSAVRSQQPQSYNGAGATTNSKKPSSFRARDGHDPREEEEDEVDSGNEEATSEQQVRPDEQRSASIQALRNVGEDELHESNDDEGVPVGQTAQESVSQASPPSAQSPQGSEVQQATSDSLEAVNQAAGIGQPALSRPPRAGHGSTAGYQLSPNADALLAPHSARHALADEGPSQHTPIIPTELPTLEMPAGYPDTGSRPALETLAVESEVGRPRTSASASSKSSSSQSKRKSTEGLDPRYGHSPKRSKTVKNSLVGPQVTESATADHTGEDDLVVQDETELEDPESRPNEVSEWPDAWQVVWKTVIARNASKAIMVEFRDYLRAARKFRVDILEQVDVPQRPDSDDATTYARRCMHAIKRRVSTRPTVEQGASVLPNPEKNAENKVDAQGGAQGRVDGDASLAGVDASLVEEELSAVQRRLGFLQPRSLLRPRSRSLQGTWNFNGTAGCGASAFAGRWVQYNQRGEIINRIVLKDVRHPETSCANSEASDMWENIDRERPREYFLQQRLNRCPESHNLVKCYAYNVQEDHRMIRLYLEDCPHGDLESVIKQHAHVRDHVRDAQDLSLDYRIPPPALWSILEAMVSAVCFMTSGLLPIHPEGGGTWQPILHRDIKPANIFLSIPHTRIWPGIPMPKVGDFGLAVEIVYGEAPSQSGTDLYMAPERLSDDNEEFLNALGSQLRCTSSEIWSIGRVMHDLMTLRRSDPKKPNAKQSLKSFPPEDEQYYSEEDPALLKLVKSCLVEHYISRPAAAALWGQIQSKVGSYRDFSLTKPPMKTEQLPEHEKLWYKQAQNDLWVPQR